MTKYRKLLGRFGEEAAQRLYLKNGFELLTTNFFNRRGKSFGEIDFVVCKNGHLHFVEVKTRTNSKYGAPIESISYQKKMRINHSVNFFLAIFSEFRSYQLHIDVALVEIDPFDKRIQRIRITTDAIEGNC